MTGHAPVGMVGLGLIGTALAARLIDARIPVIGFDIARARCSAFRDIGGKPADRVAQVFASCRTIVIAVYGASQAQALVDELDPATPLSDAVMICSTTRAPTEILDIARRADSLRLSLVEAPLSGTSAEVREGSAMALLAGRARAIEADGSVLGALCPRQTCHQSDPATQPRGACRGDRIRGSHRPRRRAFPRDRTPIGGLFQGD